MEGSYFDALSHNEGTDILRIFVKADILDEFGPVFTQIEC
jgi:hypothetical protein